MDEILINQRDSKSHSNFYNKDSTTQYNLDKGKLGWNTYTA